MKYTWKITSIEATDTDIVKNAIVRVEWKKIGTDEDGNTGIFVGLSEFPEPSIKKGFIDIKKIKEVDVISWIEEDSKDYEDFMHGKISEQIKEKAGKKRKLDFDWIEKSDETPEE